MSRLFKNKTLDDVSVSYGNTTLIIPAQTQVNLLETFQLYELSSSTTLIELIGQGIEKFQLSDGVQDLSVVDAIDLIRFNFPKKIELEDRRSSNGLLRVNAEKTTDGKKLTLITPDWGDKTTWYYKSRKLNKYQLTDSGDHQTYEGYGVWIDNFHGKYTGEDYSKNDLGEIPRLKVYVDGQIKNEVDPHNQIGDFVVDYDNAKVSFISPIDSSSIVTVDVWLSTTSCWIIAPTAGKKIIIDLVEAQFSKNIKLNDSVIFQLYIYNPYDYPNKIAYGEPSVYKTMMDFINESNRSYPEINKPSLENQNWRSMKHDMLIFNWDYQISLELSSAFGAEIRIFLQHDSVFEGSATAAFYCRVFDL
jgi:hypothetical protein